jgi:hypothetical protein
MTIQRMEHVGIVVGDLAAATLTALAITSPRMNREASAWTVMASLPHRASGITSVGLNAVGR